MPELPEVETVMRGLQSAMEGARFSRVEVRRENLRFPFPARFAPRLEGRVVKALTRRAKYVLGHLDDEATLIMHLGMSGRFTIAGGPGLDLVDHRHNQMGEPVAHEHVVFHMGTSKSGTGARIGYVDPRRFGLMDLAGPGEIESHRLLGNLGIEPLGGALDVAFLQAAFAGRRAPLKAALLDQRIIAGLGNIYVCEALFRAGLSPKRPAMSLAGPKMTARAQLLVSSIIETLEEAITAGGSSLRDYVQTDGNLGYFQHNFAVYGRESEPCPRRTCTGTITRLAQSGRSTFHCPRCQK